MFLFYSLVYSLGVILAAPYYLWRGRAHVGPKIRWRERLGDLPSSYKSSHPGAIWVHAVSVGETLAVAGLVKALLTEIPARKVFLSHVTPAGREAGERRVPVVAGRFYVPLDWGWCVRRVLARIQPALLVIVETELWPNLIREARRSGARVLLVNARLSERSFRGYSLIRPLMRRLLDQVDWICAQTEEDASRFRRLGARPGRVIVAGNLKFDAELPRAAATEPLRSALDSVERSPLLVAASTMKGEEELLLESWDKIRGAYSQAMLLLAPRHPARFDEVAEILSHQGRRFIRRTALPIDPAKLSSLLAGVEILLLDTIGELAGMFELGDIVFMGGSLVATGGHNLLEPAYWGKPILFGPHMENFRDVAQLFLSAGAAIQVRDANEFAHQALELLKGTTRRSQMGEKAKGLLERSSGATQRVLGQIKELLEADTPIRAAV